MTTPLFGYVAEDFTDLTPRAEPGLDLQPLADDALALQASAQAGAQLDQELHVVQDSVQVLERIEEVLTNPQTEFSAPEAQVLDQALEALTQRLQRYQIHPPVVAVEAFARPQGRAAAKALALETLGETVAKIWAWVGRMLAKAWAWVQDFYDKFLGATTRLRRQAEKIAEKAKGASIHVIKVPVTEEIFNALRVSGKMPDGAALVGRMKDLAGHAGSALEQAATRFERIVADFERLVQDAKGQDTVQTTKELRAALQNAFGELAQKAHPSASNRHQAPAEGLVLGETPIEHSDHAIYATYFEADASYEDLLEKSSKTDVFIDLASNAQPEAQVPETTDALTIQHIFSLSSSVVKQMTAYEQHRNTVRKVENAFSKLQNLYGKMQTDNAGEDIELSRLLTRCAVALNRLAVKGLTLQREYDIGVARAVLQLCAAAMKGTASSASGAADAA